MPAATPYPPGGDGSTTVELEIDGSPVTLTTARLVIDRLTQTLDGVDVLEFHEIGGSIVPGQSLGQSVDFSINGTLRFHGRLTQCQSGRSDDGYTHAYVALGYEYLANQIPITNPATGDATYIWNLTSSDPDHLASYAGQTLEDMIVMVIEDHYTELDAIGIGPFDGSGHVDGNFETALHSLDFTPAGGAVSLSGERLWQALQGLLEQYAPQYCLHINPDGTMCLFDTTDLDAVTLTTPDDWIDPPGLSYDVSDCSTAVLIRGGPQVDAAKLSTADGTLTEDWTGGEESAWTWADFATPQDGRSKGAVTSSTSTTVTVDPDDAARTWSTNEWGPADRAGWVILYDSVLTGVDQWCARAVASNTSLSAGGTSVLTVDIDLPGTGWDSYDLVGYAQGRAHVWRRYTPTETDLQTALLKRFPTPLPFRFENGVQQTQSPMGEIHFSDGSLEYAQAAPIEVDPGTGTIWWSRPVVAANNSLDVLLDGGGSVVEPDDVVAWVPIRKGRLEARYPSSGYAGTAYDDAGIEHEMIIDLPSWNDPGAQAQFEEYAEELHASVSDVVIEGDVVLHGLGGNLALGICLDLAAKVGSATLTTGLESAHLPVRSITVLWPQSGPDVIQTQYHVSNRRRPLSGDRLFQAIAHWEPQVSAGGAGESLTLGGPVALPGLPGLASPISAGLARMAAATAAGLAAATPRLPPQAQYPSTRYPTTRFPGMPQP